MPSLDKCVVISCEELRYGSHRYCYERKEAPVDPSGMSAHRTIDKCVTKKCTERRQESDIHCLHHGCLAAGCRNEAAPSFSLCNADKCQNAYCPFQKLNDGLDCGRQPEITLSQGSQAPEAADVQYSSDYYPGPSAYYPTEYSAPNDDMQPQAGNASTTEIPANPWETITLPTSPATDQASSQYVDPNTPRAATNSRDTSKSTSSNKHKSSYDKRSRK
ncbi:uncharacterized protein E0L32_005291 [Thyridium curvatum]|uniref:Uncharacterized protein n=1 Tax=Thyridium curvatum TaxID=1093900 RepID=A0A507BB50_9PEZI|nr:uncharacterized protein E0L32_005291 [Thyridium curvatum]TPX14599.1 hypothetical protein E0L32_005291 [Thyridium curvatum]